MSGLISGLAGAGGSANAVGNFYSNGENQLVNAYGSPAANMFSKEYIASLQPGFKQQDQALAGTLAAQGITNSGAAKADYSDLAGAQSAAEASGIAPLYSQALGQYGGLVGQGAGAQAGAYQGAIQDFYQGVGGIANLAAEAYGVPTGGFSGGGGGGSGGYSYAGSNSGNNTGSDNPYAGYG